MTNQNAPTVSTRSARWLRYWRGFQFTLAALEIGSRAVSLADNRELVRDLAARAESLHL